MAGKGEARGEGYHLIKYSRPEDRFKDFLTVKRDKEKFVHNVTMFLQMPLILGFEL